jgi:hypothetical protein
MPPGYENAIFMLLGAPLFMGFSIVALIYTWKLVLLALARTVAVTIVFKPRT